MNLLERLGLAKWFYPQELCLELKGGLRRAQEVPLRLGAPNDAELLDLLRALDAFRDDAKVERPRERHDAARDVLTVTPLRKVGHPDDVAGAVAYLASDEAGFITGTIIDITGGYFMP